MGFSNRSGSLALPGCLILLKMPRGNAAHPESLGCHLSEPNQRMGVIAAGSLVSFLLIVLLSLLFCCCICRHKDDHKWVPGLGRPSAHVTLWKYCIGRCLKQLSNAKLVPMSSHVKCTRLDWYIWIFMALSPTVPTLPTAKKQSGSCADGSAESALNSPGFHWDGKNCPK